jgi:hypothetical protein
MMNVVVAGGTGGRALFGLGNFKMWSELLRDGILDISYSSYSLVNELALLFD